MSSEKNKQKKSRLHFRNKNRDKYDLGALITSNPELKNYIIPNKFGVKSVDFSNPLAVKILNKALLNHYYGIKNWEFPDENLCPPIPGRADYIHHIADLLGENKKAEKVTNLSNVLEAILPFTNYSESAFSDDAKVGDPLLIISEFSPKETSESTRDYSR